MSTKFIRFVAVLAILVSVAGNTGVARADHGAPPRVSAQNLEPRRAAEPQPLDLPALNSPAASSPGVQFLHVATAANTNWNWTYIDHPLTNGKPDAIILVTPNENPGHVGGTADDHPISVGYNGGFWGIFNQDGAAMPVGAAFNVIIPTAGAFVHTVTTTTVSGDHTFINNALTNGHPNAIILVTPNRDPGGICPCVPTNFPIGVSYSGTAKKWAIFNQNHTEMPVGAAFNVFVLTAGAGVFVQTATTNNVGKGISTTIDNPLTNGYPNAIVFVTPNLTPGGVCGCVVANFPIGVYYDDYGIGQWTIFNEDNAPMPVGAAFNVLVLVPRSDIFINTKTNSATGAPYSLFDNALTNGNPNAIVFTTQNWNPGGVGGKGFDQPIGVGYLYGMWWGILVQNWTFIPAGTAFNVVVPNPDTSVFVHKATTANILSHSTIIDYPLTNGNPNAIIFVTHNYDPGGVDEVYLDEAIGVFYDGSKWRIYNESGDAMTVGAAFNVFVPTAGPGVGVFVTRFTGYSGRIIPIDNPLTNGNPNAIILVTHNYSPDGVGSVNADFPIGVRYYSTSKKWGIFSQDGTNMTNTTAFNVYVFANYKAYLPLVRR
jgi:hypothetical protein